MSFICRAGEPESEVVTEMRCLTISVVVFLGMAWMGPEMTMARTVDPENADPLDFEAPEESVGWIPLFDGTLRGWKSREIGDEGTVCVEDGSLRINAGGTLNSVTYAGDLELPTDQYELDLEAMRLDGSDFFATTTFPIGDDYCSFVVGGWGGGLVGLSSVDRMDASENSTSTWRSFSDNTWYRIRIQVNHGRIRCWIDGEKYVDFEVRHHQMSTRFEVSCCEPLGIGTWCTSAKIRNIRLRHITTDGRPMTETSLFDGKSLEDWSVADTDEFAKHGVVEVVAGAEGTDPALTGELHLGTGESMTGVRYTGDVPIPGTNYEVLFDAKRVKGMDFFAGMTIPVGKEYTTLILGGWGGRVCGLSDVDGRSAVENATTTSVPFENETWYRIRLRVSDDWIQVFVRGPEAESGSIGDSTGTIAMGDGPENGGGEDRETDTSDGEPEPIILLNRKGRCFEVWPQQKPMRPFGIATWFTHGAIRNLRLRTWE
ncbi:MAG: DUF1080 domain-containing protein [Planctomycetia bacterium]|nr:DUF1080 domain-containing protein [Planctomycetia bacterium]